MGRKRAIAESAHVLAMGLWLGALVMTGVAAAIAFPTMKQLDPSLPAYAGYGGEHWRIAAGLVMARVFVAADTVQLACAGVAGVTLVGAIVATPRGDRRNPLFIRLMLFAPLFAVLVYNQMFLAPRMSFELGKFSEAALAGEAEKADEHRAEFNRLHPRATLVLAASALFAAGTLAAGAYTLTRGQPRDDDSPDRA